MKVYLVVISLFLVINYPLAGQINLELNSSEIDFSSLSEEQKFYLNTYSEQKRWEIFNSEIANFVQNQDPQYFPEWESLGPNTIDSLAGRVLSLVIHPHDNNILYAGTGCGGVWKSVDGGDNWVAITDDLPSMRVSAIAINPNNPNEILIGTGIGKVISIALQPGVGVLKSNDGGETWTPTSLRYPLSQIVSSYVIEYDPEIKDRVYLGATNGFFISEDGGETWRNSLPSRVYDIEIHPTVTGRIYAGVQFNGLMLSEDNGETWKAAPGSLPIGSQVFRTEIAIADSMPDHMVVMMINSNGHNLLGMYKTNNGGITWNRIFNAPNVSCQPSNPNSCSGWLFATIGIAPSDPNILFIGGVQFWISYNGGTTWTWKDYLSNGTGEENKNLVYVDHWDLDFDNSDPGTLYVSCDGGVIKSKDYGRTWVRKSKGMVNAMTYAVATHPEDAKKMIGGFHDHGLQSLDMTKNGLTWKRWSTLDGIAVLIDHSNPQRVYGKTHTGTIFRSDHFGQGLFNSIPVMNGIQESSSWVFPLVMHPEKPQTLWNSTSSKIYKTVNGGGLWRVVANIPNVQQIEINKINPNKLYAHRFNSNSWAFYRSEDEGESWENLSSNNVPTWGVTAIESDPHDENRIYVTRNSVQPFQDHIKVSEDDGISFRNITHDLPDIRVYDVLVSPLNENHLFLATDLGVYWSENKGENWQPFNGNLPRIYSMSLEYSPADTTLRVATLGRGVWKTSLKNLVLSTDVVEVDKKKLHGLRIFPNPSSSELNLEFENAENKSISINLIGLDGKLITSLLKNDRNNHLNITINPKNFVIPGVYVLQITVGSYVAHRKIIVQ